MVCTFVRYLGYALYVLLLVISSVAFSDLRDNMEAAASVYSQAAGLILGDDFTLLQVHQWGLCVIILYCVILRVYMCVCVLVWSPLFRLPCPKFIIISLHVYICYTRK